MDMSCDMSVERLESFKKLLMSYSLLKISPLILLFLLLPNKMLAQFAGGDGTSGNPYQISTPAQLDGIRDNLDKHFIIINDIDLNVSPYNSGSGWEPIVDGISDFEGSLDGNNYTISNLFIDGGSSNNIGLIADMDVGSEVKNLRLKDVNITGNGNTGALVGISNGIITNVHITGSVSGGNNNTDRTGGIVGNYAGFGYKLTESSFIGNVTGRGTVGGIAGLSTPNTSYIFPISISVQDKL